MQLEDDDQGPTIEAFRDLSLQRDRQAEIRGGRGMSRGKAQGLRGLAMGGRAGMAKRNLAGLAPDFVQASSSAAIAPSIPAKPISKLSALAARSSAKRPAENPPLNTGNRPRPASPASSADVSNSPATSDPASASAKPSKLAALAAARSGTSMSKVASSQPPASSISIEAPAKPLTKLQQRMLANKQQRTAATPEAREAAAIEAAEEEARSRPQTCYGSDLPIASLFPGSDAIPPATSASPAAGRRSASLASTSAIAGTSEGAGTKLIAPIGRVRAVPGGSPFALYVPGSAEVEAPQIDLVKKAFAGPSPDDVVEKAREGTRLGAR